MSSLNGKLIPIFLYTFSSYVPEVLIFLPLQLRVHRDQTRLRLVYILSYLQLVYCAIEKFVNSSYMYLKALNRSVFKDSALLENLVNFTNRYRHLLLYSLFFVFLQITSCLQCKVSSLVLVFRKSILNSYKETRDRLA